MNYQKRNGISTMSDSSKRVTIINGIEYPWVKGMRGCSTTTINGKVFIDVLSWIKTVNGKEQ